MHTIYLYTYHAQHGTCTLHAVHTLCTRRAHAMHTPHTHHARPTQWSRDIFEGLFKQSGEDVNAYLSQPEYLAALERQPGVRRTAAG